MSMNPLPEPVSAVMITLNSERLLPAVLNALRWCDEVVVVDSGSTDRTLAIARQQGARVIHRVGLLLPLDQVVLVAVTSKHRGESFRACEFLMDYLKTQAPFWKKEQTAEGARWVDARLTDDAALARWGIAGGNA